MDKMRERKLRWFEYIMRREESKAAVRMVMKINVGGTKGRGEAEKEVGLDVIKNYIRTACVCKDDVRDSNGNLGRR